MGLTPCRLFCFCFTIYYDKYSETNMPKNDKLDAERNAAKLPDSKFDAKELKKGTDREMEHTKSREEAEKIAKQHLFDNPRYYSELDKAGFEELELEEKWSAKYKRSIDCKNPKGFSQKAHCQGRKKKVNEQADLESGSDDTFAFDPKSDKFVEKPTSKEVKLFVLIGPPAVGKSTWEKKYFAGIPEKSILRINRDILIEKMFLSTGFSNKQLFTPVPADLPSDYVHPEFGRVIEYQFNNKVRRAYEKPYKAANSINEKYYKLIMEAVSGYYDYVLLDGIYATPDDRKRAVDLLSAIPNLEKIAVYFESKGHEEEIIGRSEKRAEKIKTQFPIVKGKYFDRTIDKEQYKGIFEKLTPPTYDEPANFDIIMNVKFGGEGEYEVLEEAKKKRGRPSKNATYVPSLIDFSSIVNLNNLNIDPRML